MLTVNPQILKEIQNDANQGISPSQSISKLHKQGQTITSSIRIIKWAYGINLAEAKNLVAGHPVWQTLTQAVQPYHDKIIKNLGKLMETDKDKVISSEMILRRIEKDGERVISEMSIHQTVKFS